MLNKYRKRHFIVPEYQKKFYNFVPLVALQKGKMAALVVGVVDTWAQCYKTFIPVFANFYIRLECL
jgi:hypothetical protein